jgi:hypothetical protein
VEIVHAQDRELNQPQNTRVDLFGPWISFLEVPYVADEAGNAWQSHINFKRTFSLQNHRRQRAILNQLLKPSFASRFSGRVGKANVVSTGEVVVLLGQAEHPPQEVGLPRK